MNEAKRIRLICSNTQLQSWTMTASVRQARAKLSSLLESAAKGEEVIITSHGQPRARLVAIPGAKGGRVDLAKIRRLARQAATGKKPHPDATRIISDSRDRI
jgi:prevent-host-death family protein